MMHILILMNLAGFCDKFEILISDSRECYDLKQVKDLLSCVDVPRMLFFTGSIFNKRWIMHRLIPMFLTCLDADLNQSYRLARLGIFKISEQIKIAN